MAVMSRKPLVSLRPDSARKVYCFQQPGESVITAQRVKKLLDGYQIDEVRLVLNGLFQAVECEIMVSYADRRESFCQRCDVLSPCQPAKLLDTLPSSQSLPLRAWAAAIRPMSNGTDEEERHSMTAS